MAAEENVPVTTLQALTEFLKAYGVVAGQRFAFTPEILRATADLIESGGDFDPSDYINGRLK